MQSRGYLIIQTVTIRIAGDEHEKTYCKSSPKKKNTKDFKKVKNEKRLELLEKDIPEDTIKKPTTNAEDIYSAKEFNQS